jgi:hypothetical protein
MLAQACGSPRIHKQLLVPAATQPEVLNHGGEFSNTESAGTTYAERIRLNTNFADAWWSSPTKPKLEQVCKRQHLLHELASLSSWPRISINIVVVEEWHRKWSSPQFFRNGHACCLLWYCEGSFLLGLNKQLCRYSGSGLIIDSGGWWWCSAPCSVPGEPEAGSGDGAAVERVLRDIYIFQPHRPWEQVWWDTTERLVSLF